MQTKHERFHRRRYLPAVTPVVSALRVLHWQTICAWCSCNVSPLLPMRALCWPAEILAVA